MKEKLTIWAATRFGGESINETFNLKEEISMDKVGRPVRTVTLFMKRRLGEEGTWFNAGVFERWVDELMTIMGPCRALSIASSEGKEIRFVGGENKAGKFEATVAKNYNYQFTLTAILEEKDGDKN